jgi:NTE family protein
MKNIGLALGGGAVLGAAHVGVIKALLELDIKIDYITGTSIGAFAGAFFAFGKSYEEIEDIALKLKWIDISDLSISKFGLLSNGKLGRLIVKHLGNKNIEDAEIPLAIIATDATNGEKVIFDKGPLAEAVMASTSIPGIFKPVELGGRTLVDGGIVENVPIDTVRNMGSDYVIAVDLNSKNKYNKPENILDVLVNSFHFLVQERVKSQTELANLLIEPDLSQFNRTSTKHVEKLIRIGYEESLRVLEEAMTKKSD